MDLNLFFEDLASEKPVPGGGSASCVAAAMAAALIKMVALLSIERNDDETMDTRFREIIERLEEAIPRLLHLAEEDAAGYQKVMEAFRLPKNSDAEISLRRAAIQKAFEGAIATPLTLLAEALTLMDWTAFALEHGNVNAFSDAGVAYQLTRTAYEGGRMNVLINLGSLRDEGARKRYLLKLKEMETDFNTKREKIEGLITSWKDRIL